MGIHAFETEPEHLALYKANPNAPVPKVRGIDEKWDMPAIVTRGSLGDGVYFPGVDHFVLTYHIGGASARRLDGHKTWPTAICGSLSLQHPYSGGTFASAGEVHYAHFYFKPSLLDDIAEGADSAADQSLQDFFGLCDSVLGRDARVYLERSEDTNNPPTSLEMDSRGHLLAADLLRFKARQREGATDVDPLQHPKQLFSKVTHAIEDQIGEEIRLNDLASLVNMSPHHFSRQFKAALGEAPFQYLMRRRVERAIDLVVGSAIPFSEIAQMLGFANPSHMSRRVKDATGQSPKALRSKSKS